MHMYTHVCMCIITCTSMCVLVYKHVHICMGACVCVHTCVYVCERCAYFHVATRICMCTSYVLVQMPVSLQGSAPPADPCWVPLPVPQAHLRVL